MNTVYLSTKHLIDTDSQTPPVHRIGIPRGVVTVENLWGWLGERRGGERGRGRRGGTGKKRTERQEQERKQRGSRNLISFLWQCAIIIMHADYKCVCSTGLGWTLSGGVPTQHNHYSTTLPKVTIATALLQTQHKHGFMFNTHVQFVQQKRSLIEPKEVHIYYVHSFLYIQWEYLKNHLISHRPL